MAEPSGSGNIEEGVSKLLLDEVTGERVSKTELKRREKARAQAAKKAEKAAAAPQPAKKEKAVNEEEAEKELTPNVCILLAVEFVSINL